MTNFPGGKFVVPSKLSPFVDDTPANGSIPSRVSRQVVSVFSSPSEEAEMLQQAEFTIPHCYFRSYIQGESEFRLKPQHLKHFTLETLFYCFYMLPGDIIQTLAAQELSARGWKYHLDLKKWFRPATGNDAPTSTGLVVFDPSLWGEKSQSTSIDQSKFMPASGHNFPAGMTIGALRTGPPGRLPPASPPSMVPQQPPVTPSSVIR